MPELALGIIAVIAAALYAREHYLRRKGPSVTSIKNPADPHSPQTDPKDEENLSEDLKKSREFFSQAETDSMKIVSDEKFFAKKAEQDFAQMLNEKLKEDEQANTTIIQNSKSEFEKATAEFTNYLN